MTSAGPGFKTSSTTSVNSTKTTTSTTSGVTTTSTTSVVSTTSTVTVFQCFDTYVSEVVGEPITTGWHEIELTADFKKALEAERIAEAEARAKAEAEAEADGEVNEEDMDKYLDYDPTDYRNHDMYGLLGLKGKDSVTPDQVKAAYRKQALLHHPDKLKQKPRRALRDGLKEDSLFKCIQKAWQVLTDPGLRADYDACDPTFDDSTPLASDPAPRSEAEFFATFGPVFARNAKFSKTKPVPLLGDSTTPRSQVEAFYSFWMRWESVRRFEWQDEDAPHGGENREEKRWMEKKNKARRDAKKKEDTMRVVRLTELAMKLDPRYQAFKDADRAAKEAKKQEKEKLTRAASDSANAQKAAAEAAKLQAEADKKAAEDAKKAEKESAKAVIKNARRAFRLAYGEPADWLVDPVKEIKMTITLNSALEQKIAATGEDIPALAALTAQILAIRGGEKSLPLAQQLLDILTGAAPAVAAPAAPVAAPVVATESAGLVSSEAAPAVDAWTAEEIDLLIIATKQFPGGALNRWEQVTHHLNRQIANTLKGVKGEWTVSQVIKQANKLAETAQGAATAGTMPVIKKRDPRVDLAEPTVALHYFADDQDRQEATSALSAVKWSSDDQAALEAAMKTVPATDAERWDRVAELVPGKSKKDCLVRIKELAQKLSQKH